MKCAYDCLVVLMVARTEKSRGRGFFRCPFWKTIDCGYFRWESDWQAGWDESSSPPLSE
ncbi:hypothetical protein LINGRAHAP2_LOCUS4908 [Linum grandiflorum]